jgi:hypothetical protein
MYVERNYRNDSSQLSCFKYSTRAPFFDTKEDTLEAANKIMVLDSIVGITGTQL